MLNTVELGGKCQLFDRGGSYTAVCACFVLLDSVDGHLCIYYLNRNPPHDPFRSVEEVELILLRAAEVVLYILKNEHMSP